MYESALKLGNGIYTTKEIASVLRVPYGKVYHWITSYWDGALGRIYETQYSWIIGNTRAVGFHTLIEFYVMMQFAEAGVTTKNVLKAHKALANRFQTHFPFALREVIQNITTDGNKIYLNVKGDIITLDGSQQLNLNLVKLFFKKLEFDDDLLASRLWPMGKSKDILCDPHHKFGQPVIVGTNIQSEAIYRMHLAGEPIRFIASLYEITIKQVQHAIEFHNVKIAA